MGASMTDLIQRLNALVGKTPDEIARRISNKGWRKPSELGEAYFLANRTTQHAYWKIQKGEVSTVKGLDWIFDSAVGAHGSYDRFVEQLETGDYCVRNNYTYWVIPMDQYTGEPPLCVG